MKVFSKSVCVFCDGGIKFVLFRLKQRSRHCWVHDAAPATPHKALPKSGTCTLV